MSRIVLSVLLFLLWHFPTTFFVPAGEPYARGWLAWPFGRESKPVLSAFEGVIAPASLAQPTSNGAPTLALVAAGLASLSLILAAAALWGIVVPSDWLRPLVVAGASLSAVLFAVYLGPWAIVPLAIDAIALWGFLTQGWSVETLNGLLAKRA